MKKYGIIYKATNLITGQCYIGQTTRSLQERLDDHIQETRNRYFSNSLKKYEVKNFLFEEIATAFSLDSLNELEVYFVSKFNTLYPNGYNHRAGGKQNGICSLELKEKISKAKLGKPLFKRRGEIRSEKQRLQISRTLGGKQIKAIHSHTGEVRIYQTAHSTKNDGFNPSNVISICKGKSKRTHSKQWKFEYVNDVNQSGSSLNNIKEHAQRIGFEPTNVE